MTETKLQVSKYEVENEDGSTRTVTQYRTTVPKDLAEALIDGDDVTIGWSIQSGTSLKATFNDNE